MVTRVLSSCFLMVCLLFISPQVTAAQTVSVDDFPGMSEEVLRQYLITIILELLAQSNQTPEIEEGTDDLQAKITEFSFLPPSVDRANVVVWDTEGTEECSIYRANGAWRGAIATDVGVRGERDVAIAFTDGVAKLELRCSEESNPNKKISAYAEITHEDLEEVTAQIFEELNNRSGRDKEAEARADIDSVIDGVAYETNRFEELRPEISDDSLEETILDSITQLNLGITLAELEYTEERFESAMTAVEDVEDDLDELVDLLDDIEDGRLN